MDMDRSTAGVYICVACMRGGESMCRGRMKRAWMCVYMCVVCKRCVCGG